MRPPARTCGSRLTVGRAAASNPFSTARTRPGAIDFQFIEGESAATLLERLRSHGWRGQIVGPHGSGKSTLLASLQAAWSGYGRKPLEMVLHDGQRQLASSFWRCGDIDASTQVIVDGYEQLSYLQRLRLKRFCRRKHCGLLITTHRSAGLPTVYRTSVDPQIVAAIVARLTAESDWRIAPQTINCLLGESHGNVRELLFHLYDVYESQRKHGS